VAPHRRDAIQIIAIPTGTHGNLDSDSRLRAGVIAAQQRSIAAIRIACDDAATCSRRAVIG
jgi:hypothetical protein